MQRGACNCYACRAFNVQVVPYAAVAGLLPEHAEAAGDEQQSSLDGRAFCFLPITTTGLPVHVNGKASALLLTLSSIQMSARSGKAFDAAVSRAGYFELSSNRRDIWHGGSGMAGVGQLRCDWNLCLLKVSCADI